MSQFALVQLGGGIAQGAIGHQLPLFSEFLNKRTSIANGVGAVAQISHHRPSAKYEPLVIYRSGMAVVQSVI